MDRTRWKGYLEITTNVAVLLVALLVLGVFARSYFRRAPRIELERGLQRGEAVAQLPSSLYSNTPQTLILALNANCVYCSESLPFYRQLAEIQHRAGAATRLVAIFPNAEDEVKQYARQSNLNIEIIPTVDFDALNIDGTPTMILLDKNGKILDFWIGKLSKEDEQQIIEVVSGSKV